MTLPLVLLDSCPELVAPLLHAYRGSIAHGMYVPSNDPDSIDDKDTMAFVVAPRVHYLGLEDWGSSGTVEVKLGEWDVVLYELRKSVRLLLQGNPNVLSMLWVPENYVLGHSWAGKALRDNRDWFSGRHVYHGFIGYARSQLKRLDSSEGKPLRELAYLAGIFDGEGHISITRGKSKNPAHADIHGLDVGITNTDRDLIEWLLSTWGGYAGRTGIQGGTRLDAYRWRLPGPAGAKFLREVQPYLIIKTTQTRIALQFAHEMAVRQRGKPLTEHEVDRREELRQALKLARRHKQTDVPESERSLPLKADPERYTQAYMGEKRKALVERHGYDTKNAAHLVRLLRMGIEFLRDGELRVDRGGLDATELLAIKRGEWSLDRVKGEAERLFRRAEDAYDRSTLPLRPDRTKVEELLVEILGAELAD